MELINPWVLCITGESIDYYKHKFMCFPVSRTQNVAMKPSVPSPLFESFETRPVLPIFPSESECVRFRNQVMRKYVPHTSEWNMYGSFSDTRTLPDLCSAVYVENVLRDEVPQSVAFDSKPVPFDFSNEDIILSMALQSQMGFFVVDSFDITNGILSMHGVITESSYENVSSDEHLEYMHGVLNQLIY